MGEEMSKEERIADMKKLAIEIIKLLDDNAPILIIEGRAFCLMASARDAVVNNAEVKW